MLHINVLCRHRFLSTAMLRTGSDIYQLREEQLLLHIFCSFVTVIMGKVVGREASADPRGEWARLALSVQAVYKRAPRSRLRRGTVALHVRARDLACKCPKLKINK